MKVLRKIYLLANRLALTFLAVFLGVHPHLPARPK